MNNPPDQTPLSPDARVDRAAELKARYSKRRTIPRIIWPVAVLALLLIFNLIFTKNFSKITVQDGHLYGSLIDIVLNVAPVAILAAGMTLVIATGGVDLSVGAVMAICGALAAKLLKDQQMAFAPAILLVLAVGALAGIWNGILVAYANVQPIVATLILMVAGRGIAQSMNNGQIPTLSIEQFQTFHTIGNGFFLMLPLSLTLVAAVYILTGLLTRNTAAGLFIESTGGNPSASRYAGVNISAVKLFAYAFCGFCASIAGLIDSSKIMAADANNAGLNLELDAILAVVIGGTALTGGRFSLVGSLVGALVIQSLVTTINSRDIRPQYNQIVKAVVVIIVCLMQSEPFRRQLAKIKSHLQRSSPSSAETQKAIP